MKRTASAVFFFSPEGFCLYAFALYNNISYKLNTFIMEREKLHQGIAVAAAFVVVGVLLASGGAFGGFFAQLGISQGASALDFDTNMEMQELFDGGIMMSDTVEGEGDEVTEGSVVSLHYVGMLEDGTVFDESRARGAEFSFTVGSGEVIDGFDLGLRGMKAGGERTLVLAPEFAYGENGIGPIPPNATLTFQVELISVEQPAVEGGDATDEEDEA